MYINNMSYHYTLSYKFKYKILVTVDSFLILSCDDEIVTLDNPKLISLLGVNSQIVLDSFEKTSSSYITNISNRSEKKHKNIINERDINKSKKFRNKLVKNKRKESDNIEKVKLLVNSSNHVFTQDLLDASDNKSRKVNNKSKKKDKRLLETVNNIPADNSLTINRNELSINKSFSKKTIVLVKPLSVQELAIEISVPETEIIRYLFLDRGISATTNKLLDIDLISNIIDHYGFNVVKAKLEEDTDYYEVKDTDSSLNVRRSPVITILGHVDHGKTTLLDAILNTNLVNKESGGITQSISGYEIFWHYDSCEYKLIFLDTPGHESFKKMRLRGAKVTDLVLLVIAVDDGLQPQTIESIQYIQKMNLSCIVVITKSDKSLNNLDKIKRDLSNYNLLCQEWGGDTTFVEVSAINNNNIDVLLSKICIMCNDKNLVANPQELAAGTIIESFLDKKKGYVANLIVQNGTLKVGDIIVAGNLYCKVKSLMTPSNIQVKFSGPSSIVKILGFVDAPQAGSLFSVCKNEKEAKLYCLSHIKDEKVNTPLNSLNTRITLDVTSDVKQLKLIIKTDTQGSLEAIMDLLVNISQSKIQLNIVYAGYGSISNSDVELAVATGSILIGFNTDVLCHIRQLLKKNEVSFKTFDIIYDLFTYIRDLMLDLVDPEYDKILIGNISVQTVFSMNKNFVAGCKVNKGKLRRDSYVHVYRNNSLIHEGFITSLKRMKDDVDEVLSVNECGLMSDFDSWKDGDTLEAYDLVTKEKTL
uniref:Translation initiation factor IF-2, chloroplastic n=1 Tax=Polysiphonia sp. TaxID=1967842 RepID=A0A1Z1MTQ6_9FLOR|nr:translation initiation factor 2 [Polysiphonia sp.]